MNKKSAILMLLAFVAFAMAFVNWRIEKKRNEPPPAHFAVVWDTSVSMPQHCDGLAGMVKNALADPMVRIGKDSRFALIPISGRVNSYEPVLAFESPIPRAEKNFFGGTGDGKTQEQFFDEIKDVCKTLEPVEASAIFRAVQIALEHLRGLGCTETANCQLIVASDLEENVNKEVVKILLRSSAAPDAPALLDNSGIRVSFCGYAQTQGAGGPRTQAPALIEGWRRLFTQTERVTFKPYCDASAKASGN